MGIYRTNDPTQFDDIDGIIIDEQAPPPSIIGVAANVGILVGQFQRGVSSLSLPLGSIGEFYEQYGRDLSYSGPKQLVNKAFGRLKLIRVVASDAVLGTLDLTASELKVEAKYKGAYGNNLKITVATGSGAVGKKYTVRDANPNPVLPTEVYDQVELIGKTQTQINEIFAASKLVNFVWLGAITVEPANLVETSLASGADGTVVDADYSAAIDLASQEKAGNVLFLDAYNATRNGYLKTHVAASQDKMAIVCGPSGNDKAAAITDAANYRDTDGRLIYAWPYVNTSINGVNVLVPPASWVASIFTQTSPHVALSFTENTRFLAGISSLEYNESRNGFIALNEAGILALEKDQDVGFLVKNAVTTNIINSEKREVLRRRMADFLTDSMAFFLKNYQNAVNSVEKRTEVKAAILDFDTRLVRDKILPGEQDVKEGKPLLVDTESLNTDSVVALGMFKILYKRRIFSSMRFIVLQAEIGTGVVVTEVNE